MQIIVAPKLIFISPFSIPLHIFLLNFHTNKYKRQQNTCNMLQSVSNKHEKSVDQQCVLTKQVKSHGIFYHQQGHFLEILLPCFTFLVHIVIIECAIVVSKCLERFGIIGYPLNYLLPDSTKRKQINLTLHAHHSMAITIPNQLIQILPAMPVPQCHEITTTLLLGFVIKDKDAD